MLTAQEMQKKVLQEYPKSKITFSMPYKNGILVAFIPESIDPIDAIAEFHYVDSKTGEVSGALSTMRILLDPKVKAALESLDRENNSDSDVIEHHGIKGQQWGVRNGPPYPLSQSKHDRVTGGKSNGATAGGYFADRKKRKQEQREKEIRERVAKLRATSKELDLKTYKAYHDRDVKNINRDSKKLYSKGIANADKIFSSDNPPRKIEGPHSQDDDMKSVNPMWKEGNPGSMNNCVLCSITYDMRRRGYDVCAKLAKEPTSISGMLDAVYGEKMDHLNAPASSFGEVEKLMLANNPEGARGMISVTNPSGGGHAMAYEVQNGKVVVYDSQTGKKYSMEDLRKFPFNPWLTSYFRTDDKKVKLEGLNDVCAEYNRDSDKLKHFSFNVYSDFLAHYGVKGQKWGVRRYQNEDGSYTEEGKNRRNGYKGTAAGSSKSNSRWKSEDVSKLSDDELQKRITRLNREKQYKEMTRSRSEKSKKWIGETAQKILVASLVEVTKEIMKAKYKSFFDDFSDVSISDMSSTKKQRGEW